MSLIWWSRNIKWETDFDIRHTQLAEAVERSLVARLLNLGIHSRICRPFLGRPPEKRSEPGNKLSGFSQCEDPFFCP